MSRLADAARENDERTDAGAGVEDVARELGVDPKELTHVAEQRALRAVVVQFRGKVGLDQMAREGQVNLGHTERAALTVYAAMYIDGIAIGLRAAQAGE